MAKGRIKAKVEEKNGGTNITIECKICGKPIVQSNFFGMYCENKCGMEKDKEAYDKIKKMFGGLL